MPCMNSLHSTINMSIGNHLKSMRPTNGNRHSWHWEGNPEPGISWSSNVHQPVSFENQAGTIFYQGWYWNPPGSCKLREMSRYACFICTRSRTWITRIMCIYAQFTAMKTAHLVAICPWSSLEDWRISLRRTGYSHILMNLWACRGQIPIPCAPWLRLSS